MFTSFRSRLIGSFALVILVTLSIAALTLPVLLRGYQDQATWARLDDQLGLTIRSIGELWREDPNARDILARLPKESLGPSGRILLIDRNGTVLADSAAGALAGQQISQVARRRRPATSHYYGEFRTPAGLRMLYVSAPLLQSVAPQRSPLVAQITPAGTWRTLTDLGRRLFIGGAIALLLGLLLGLLLARSISRPLASISHATEEIARGNLDHRLELEGPDEVLRVANSFNAMSQEVKTSRQAQQDFVANVSHDLKTPLTSIKGFAQALLDGTASDAESQKRAARVIHSEAEHMTRLVEQLLELARWDAGHIAMDCQPMDLSSVLSTCVERSDWRASEKSISLQVDIPELPDVLGDGNQLAQVFSNLLDNALTYTPKEGSVSLAAEFDSERNRIVVSVTDTGPGIPAEELPRVFERFYRVDKARAASLRGWGLGLAIVKQIVEAHGGDVSAESMMGLGTRFIVVLPAHAESTQNL